MHKYSVCCIMVLFCLASFGALAQETVSAETDSYRIVCPAGQICNVSVRMPAAERMMAPQTVSSEKGTNIDDKLIVALRATGSYGIIPGPDADSRKLWSSTGDVVIQLRNFLSPNWGLEFATGMGAAFYPNNQAVFYGVAEGGVLWHPGRFESMLGYDIGVGASSYDTLLQRHNGVLRLRYYFLPRLGVELSGQIGWGSHVWETTREYQAPNPDQGGELWWYEDRTTKHYEGLTGSCAAGLILRW